MRSKILVKGASGSGKTTFAATIADRLRVPHVELDALNHGPAWTQATAEGLRSKVAASLEGLDAWVVDGNYDSKLGTWLLDQAELIIWLDLPLALKMRRLWRRTLRRIRDRQTLWNGNQESWRTAFWGRESLFVWAVRTHFRHRREWPILLDGRPVVRLRTTAEVVRFLRETVATTE